MNYEFLQPFSEEIFQTKYNLHNESSTDELFRNISKEIASAEEENKKEIWEDKFFEEISSGRFIPAGRILANARPNSKMKNYNNCFTIEFDDSMEGIFQGLKDDAMISKMGGGVGFDVSVLRPNGASITKGGESSGPVTFLKIFDASAKTIHVGGNRRSAHIALMDISHPDIEEFITVKQGILIKSLPNSIYQ
jgi:ribonucleoside-diphosphate reductase alpha chain